jgi:hypothetical protein
MKSRWIAIFCLGLSACASGKVSQNGLVADTTAPTATAVAPVWIAQDTSSGTIVLTGTDPNNSVDSLAVTATNPAHGTLTANTGAAPLSVRYVPASGFSGDDSFSFPEQVARLRSTW